MSSARALSYALSNGKRLPLTRAGAVADVRAAIEEHDTITAAAEALGVSQDALQRFRNEHRDVAALAPLQARGAREKAQRVRQPSEADTVLQITNLLGSAAQLARAGDLGEETFIDLARSLFMRWRPGPRGSQ